MVPGARARLCAALVLLDALSGPAVSAAELQPRTVAAFDRYVRVSEQRMAEEVADPKRFLWLDSRADPAREREMAALRRGELVIERLSTREGGKEIEVPDGLVHHWLGLVFVPGATLERAVRLLQDYNRHAQVYHPAVADSRLLSRSGDLFRVFLRFEMKKVITVVVNSEHEARFTQPDANRAYSRVVSTRIAEVEDPGTSGERERPVGHDGGYLWRLNSYWRFIERDGGTYLQCESISLSRGIPPGFGWLIGPFVTSIPRESLTFTLDTSRRVLARPAAAGL